MKELEGEVIIKDVTLNFTEKLSTFPIDSRTSVGGIVLGVVVSSEKELNQIYDMQKSGYGNNASEYTHSLAIDFTDDTHNEAIFGKMTEEIFTGLNDYIQKQSGGSNHLNCSVDSIWDARISVIGMYGSLLFLGIILGAVCLFATVLIIYYKQISEGYEDRSRFQIMQKIGMSSKEVKKAINSQILLVFFLPLVVSGIHLAFAFPILEKILHVLLLSSTELFIGCSVAVFVIFALVYTIIYSLTAKTYYKIVR